MNLPLKKVIAIRYGRARVTSPAFDLGAVAPARQDPVALVAHSGVHRGRDGGGWLPPERQTFELFSRHIELKTVEAYLPG